MTADRAIDSVREKSRKGTVFFIYWEDGHTVQMHWRASYRQYIHRDGKRALLTHKADMDAQVHSLNEGTSSFTADTKESKTHW